jgi:hypothetical protein
VLLIILTNSGRRIFLFPVFFFFFKFPSTQFFSKFQKIGGVHSKIHALKSTPNNPKFHCKITPRNEKCSKKRSRVRERAKLMVRCG